MSAPHDSQMAGAAPASPVNGTGLCRALCDKLRRAEQKPDHFADLLETLVAHPSKEHAQAFYDSVAAFRDWGITPRIQAAVQFARDTEWNWRDGRPPLQDC